MVAACVVHSWIHCYKGFASSLLYHDLPQIQMDLFFCCLPSLIDWLSWRGISLQTEVTSRWWTGSVFVLHSSLRGILLKSVLCSTFEIYIFAMLLDVFMRFVGACLGACSIAPDIFQTLSPFFCYFSFCPFLVFLLRQPSIEFLSISSCSRVRLTCSAADTEEDCSRICLSDSPAY